MTPMTTTPPVFSDITDADGKVIGKKVTATLTGSWAQFNQPPAGINPSDQPDVSQVNER